MREPQAGGLGRAGCANLTRGWAFMLQSVHPAAQHQRLRGGALPHGVRVARVHQDAAVHRALPGGRLHGHREGGADDQRVSLASARAAHRLLPLVPPPFLSLPHPPLSSRPLLGEEGQGQAGSQQYCLAPSPSGAFCPSSHIRSSISRGSLWAGSVHAHLESVLVLTRQVGPVSVLTGQVRSGCRDVQ